MRLLRHFRHALQQLGGGLPVSGLHGIIGALRLHIDEAQHLPHAIMQLVRQMLAFLQGGHGALLLDHLGLGLGAGLHFGLKLVIGSRQGLGALRYALLQAADQVINLPAHVIERFGQEADFVVGLNGDIRVTLADVEGPHTL